MKNLLLIPFREEGNMFYWGKKENTQLALSSSKVFTPFLTRARKAKKKKICFEALTLGQSSPVLNYDEKGDRDIFSAFIFGPCFIKNTTGRRYQRGALPAARCLSWGRTEKPPLLTQGSWWARRIRQRWLRGCWQSSGASCGSLVGFYSERFGINRPGS